MKLNDRPLGLIMAVSIIVVIGTTAILGGWWAAKHDDVQSPDRNAEASAMVSILERFPSSPEDEFLGAVHELDLRYTDKAMLDRAYDVCVELEMYVRPNVVLGVAQNLDAARPVSEHAYGQAEAFVEAAENHLC